MTTDRTTATDVRARLAEMAAAHAAATPGVWSATGERADGGAYIDTQPQHRPNDGAAPWVGHACRADDAAAIVAEHNAFPDLLALATAVCDLADEHEKWARVNAELARQDMGGADLHDGLRMAQEASAARLRTTIAAHLTPGETR